MITRGKGLIFDPKSLNFRAIKQGTFKAKVGSWELNSWFEIRMQGSSRISWIEWMSERLWTKSLKFEISLWFWDCKIPRKIEIRVAMIS